jgi:hypothetical protein
VERERVLILRAERAVTRRDGNWAAREVKGQVSSLDDEVSHFGFNGCLTRLFAVLLH